MIVFTDKDTQVFDDIINCWVKDKCLFIKYKHLENETINMIPLVNITKISGIDIKQWK